MIKITKACKVAFMKAKNSLIVRCREKRVNWKKTENGENRAFKTLANRFWLTSKLIRRVKCLSNGLHEKVMISQPAFTCSKLTIETLEQGVNYV